MTTISAINNEFNEMGIGGVVQGKGNGNNNEESFSQIVNYLKRGLISEATQVLPSAGDIEKDITEDSIDIFELTAIANYINQLLPRTSIENPVENTEGVLEEPNEKISLNLHNSSVNNTNEIKELLIRLRETSSIDEIKMLTSNLTSILGDNSFSDFIKGNKLSENEFIEEPTSNGIVLSEGEKSEALGDIWNKDFRVTKAQEIKVIDSDKGLSNTSSRESKLAEKNPEESIISEDVTFLKSLIEEKVVSKGSFSGIITRTPIESDYTYPKAIPVVNGKTLNEDLISVINYVSKGNVQELKVKVTPEELGTMIVRLSVEENGIKAKVRVTSEETYKLLLNNLGELKNNLSSGEIKIQDVEISYFKEESYYYSEGNRNNSFWDEDKNKNKHYTSEEETINNRNKEGLRQQEILIEGSINSLV